MSLIHVVNLYCPNQERERREREINTIYDSKMLFDPYRLPFFLIPKLEHQKVKVIAFYYSYVVLQSSHKVISDRLMEETRVQAKLTNTGK